MMLRSFSPSAPAIQPPLHRRGLLLMSKTFLSTMFVAGLTLASTVQAQTYARVESITYRDDFSTWVLGSVERRTVSTVEGGLAVRPVEVEWTEYTARMQPHHVYAFGKLQQTLGYHADGTVASVTDGRGHTTDLSDWKRGIPQSIQHPATPEAPAGATESAVVNDAGWLRSVTDAAGAVTSYEYDAMGRVSRVTHPIEADMVWNDTTQTFMPSTTSAHELPAGHWQQTVATGNARKVTYFDALWRPVVEHEYDAADPSGTARFKRSTYDHDGRVTFAAYPGSTSVLTAGVWTEYDALGRVKSVSQDSEHGLLTTLTKYESGFLRRTTNPRKHSTLERFQAFDEPTYDYPVQIDAPEGTRTTIMRDVFGKPVSMTRGSSN